MHPIPETHPLAGPKKHTLIRVKDSKSFDHKKCNTRKLEGINTTKGEKIVASVKNLSKFWRALLTVK